MKVILFISIIGCNVFYLFMFCQHKSSHVLYLRFPKDAKKYTTQELVSYDRKTKERTYRIETLYHFPCKSVIGDFRFITVNQAKSKYVTDNFIKNINIKDCRWIESYKGIGLNQYNQNSEFSAIYIVEKNSIGRSKLIEIKPELAEYN